MDRCEPRPLQSFKHPGELDEQCTVCMAGLLRMGSKGTAQFVGDHIGDDPIECLADETAQPLLHGLACKKRPVDAIGKHPSNCSTVFFRREVTGTGQKEAKLSRHSLPIVEVTKLRGWTVFVRVPVPFAAVYFGKVNSRLNEFATGLAQKLPSV